MKTLIYGAGTLGCLYAHRLFTAGKDVTLLARGEQNAFIRGNGVVLVNEFTAERECSKVPVVETLEEDVAYDLVVVLIRKNKLAPVFEALSHGSRVKNILFMGNNALAADRDGLLLMVRACKEGGDVLRAAGYTKRQPFKWNLFYWLPELLTAKMFGGLLNSRYAEIAFAQHAKAAQDEMRSLANEFKTLIDRTSLPTPNIDRLRGEA